MDKSSGYYKCSVCDRVIEGKNYPRGWNLYKNKHYCANPKCYKVFRETVEKEKETNEAK